MAMHGDVVERDGELYVDGERVIPVDEDSAKSDGSAGDTVL